LGRQNARGNAVILRKARGAMADDRKHSPRRRYWKLTGGGKRQRLIQQRTWRESAKKWPALKIVTERNCRGIAIQRYFLSHQSTKGFGGRQKKI